MSLTAATAGLISAGVAAAGNVTSGVVSSSGRRKSQKRAFEYNKQLADYQNQLNLRNWDLANQYNSPVAQVQRMKEAGLNPNLMYQQGGTGNASGAPEAVTPEYPELASFNGDFMAGTASAFGQGIQSVVAAQQMDLARSQTEVAQARAISQALDNAYKVRTLGVREDLQKHLAAVQEKNVQLMEKRVEMQGKMIDQMQLRDDFLRAGVRLSNAKMAQTLAATRKLLSDGDISAWHASLARAGVSPKDNALIRGIANYLQNPANINATAEKVFDYIMSLLE